MAVLQDINVNVNAQPSGKRLQTFLNLSQNENGRRINFRILGAQIPAYSTAVFSGTKPDGNVYSTAGTVSGNYVIVLEDMQMTAIAGVWDAKLDIINGENNIMSALIRVTVDPDVVAPGAIASDSQLQGLVAEAKHYAEIARSDAYGSPLTASTEAGMVDKTRVYVYTGSETGLTFGDWYYWDGEEWADGGVYNASAIVLDTSLSTSSENAVQNKVVTAGVNAVAGDVGNKANLTTSAKTNLVAAINEVDDHADQAAEDIGVKSNLKTTEKGSLVGAVNELYDDNAALKEDLTQKANADGSYDTLTAGNAKQLLSNLEQTDIVPYNYRPAGGSLEIGDRMKLKKIVGVSLPVNQLYLGGTASGGDKGITYQKGNNCSITVDGTATADYVIVLQTLYDTHGDLLSNHVYFISGCPKNGSNTTYYVGVAGLAIDTGNGGLYKHTYSWTSTAFRYDIRKDAVLNNATTALKYIDVTLLLGPTIADYVYSLETATAGAGVAWLKARFPRIFDSGYIPYNAGTFEHVNGLSAHKMVGFNQWDEQWENGRFNITTGAASTGNGLRNKNMIRVIPNTVYHAVFGNYSQGVVVFLYYDANGGFLSYEAKYSADFNFTTPDFACYLNFNLQTSSAVTAYHNDICINLHWDGERDGEYEPYEEHSYPLDSDVTLRGIYKLDANNQLYADGDEYEADGTVTRKYGIVDMGTLAWTNVDNNAKMAYFTFTDAKHGANNSYLMNAICPKYQIITRQSLGYSSPFTIEGIGIDQSGQFFVTFPNESWANTAAVKTALSGVYLVYELATPTTEEADPYTEIQNVSNWGTEEFVTTSLVPVGHETEYQPDLRAKIEVAPESPDTDGLYLMKRENGQNSYVAYLGELPSDPSEDGTYTLKATVSSGTVTKTWEADT